MRIVKYVVVGFGLLVMTALTSCGGSSSSGTSSCGVAAGTVDPAVAGDWRILTETIFFDSGLSQQATPVTTVLSLSADGTWTFGTSSGTWSVSDLAASDWTTWNGTAGAQTRKVILEGWDGCPGDGPIDEAGGVVDNIWIVYAYSSEVSGDGDVWLKFYK